ncbi:YkuS family protein [Desulfofundulus thermosubterraneus]|uniref:Uncharacterized protein family (UPF0180) n=1 Tax=Desulfofundulus thermosubterraneus DSM 16057 TaxID=1121432 RepID=A0A1M6KQ72_9FIRM|nr:YkuS family protein [Desulfofundulus thermosubterraneus]SHJ61046.1 Uncharacterised protein family (UPF0180) [Desulfofundulus thermosubterraneus DSM 16057]
MKIAVQDNLEEVKKFLASRGYEVVSPSNALGAAAMVVTGDIDAREEEQTLALATNPTITTYAPVINAAGRSPEEILQRIREVTGERKA